MGTRLLHAYFVKRVSSVTGGPRVERALQLIAEVEAVLDRPVHQHLVHGNGADFLDDLLLRSLPERDLLGGILLGPRGVDLGVGDLAMREVRDGGRRLHDRPRVEELRQIDIGHGEAGGLEMHDLREILADLRVEGRVFHRRDVERDAGTL